MTTVAKYGSKKQLAFNAIKDINTGMSLETAARKWGVSQGYVIYLRKAAKHAAKFEAAAPTSTDAQKDNNAEFSRLIRENLSLRNTVAKLAVAVYGE